MSVPQQQMEARVRELYDYDAIVSKAPSPEDVEFIFGYGSILFRQGFDASHTFPGYIKGWKRVFWQNSTDHRGVPEAPGRTVTLVPDGDSITWGVAYRLPHDLEERRECLKALEWREKQYDTKVFTELYGSDGTVVVSNALTYVGSADPTRNLNWGGPKPEAELAEQIAAARGPSGPNFEYLYRIAEGLRELGVEDEHVFELEKLVRSIRGD